MASNNQSNNDQEANTKKATALDTVASKLLGFSDDTYTAVGDIQKRGERFQSVINRQMDIAKGISGGSLIDFAQNLRNERQDKAYGNRNNPFGSQTMELTQQLQANANDLYSYFQDMYQNKYIEMADLQFISKFIPALGEAVNTTLDAIVSSDELSDTLMRNFDFDANVSESCKKAAIAEIKNMEKEYNLQKKLKNNVYKTTLVSGKYYVYAISYEDLFSNYSRDREFAQNTAPFNGSPKLPNKPRTGLRAQPSVNARPSNESEIPNDGVFESYYGIGSYTKDITLNVEELKDIVTEESAGIRDKEVKKQYDNFASYIQDHVSSVKIIHSSVLESALEDLPIVATAESEGVNDPDYKGVYDKFFGTTPIVYGDDGGTVSTSKVPSIHAEKNWGISGTYIKYIEPKNIIPIKLMDTTIGYYYMSCNKKPFNKKNGSSYSTNNVMDPHNGVFNAVSLSESHKNAIVDSIMDSITDEIVAQFGKKFISKNSQFKKTIADCITFNGYIDNEYHIQFIPAENIIEFTIDEDDDGNGRSILANSLFPAKLLLSLQVAKMLNYLNKSGDRTIVHIKKGPIDVNTGNQVQRVIRNIQETNITFSDLLSTNLVFNKFGRNQNVIMPTARNGDHLAEFETQEGMNMDMNPEYEQNLEKQAIMGTGVPSVIMDYVGQTEFAKGFETGNIKFAGRIASDQSDLEGPTTKLYDVLVQNSNLSSEYKAMLKDHFRFKLPRPKVLVTSNNTEYLTSLQSMMNIVASFMLGDDTSDPNMAKVKVGFMKLAAEKFAPYINWDDMKELYEKAKIEYDQNKDIQDQQATNGEDMSGGPGF